MTEIPDGSILAEAYRVTSGKRREDYGTPDKNHALTAAFWKLYDEARGPDQDGLDVCLKNILQKISRHACGGQVTRDTFVDIAGFAQNAAFIHGDET